MELADYIQVPSNLCIEVRERGKLVQREEGHNVYVNIGRQFLAEVITAASFSGASFTRHQDDVVRYIGFGIGGSRQTASAASSPPYSTDYGGTNAQTDTDVTVPGLERPVRVTAAPLWMQQVATPGTFPSATETTFIANFAETDISYGGYSSVPISEIGLFRGAADPSLPNGSAGAYPGSGGHILAYDTFNPVHKTGVFTIQARWTLRF